MMRRRSVATVTEAVAFLAASVFLARSASSAGSPPAQTFSLASPDHVRAIGVRIAAAEYRGRKALHVVGEPNFNGYQMATLESSSFTNGVIEAEVVGQPVAGASAQARGFVGVAFHAASDGSHFECFYLRPTNARSDDQVRRNHVTQYIAEPGFPWERFRKDNPGQYESYVDLVPGEWTRLRIEVDGRKARLFVDGASQPALVVNDLKLAETTGSVALWIGDETDAWFRNVVITTR